jgi:hypothetical protein
MMEMHTLFYTLLYTLTGHLVAAERAAGWPAPN